MKQKPTEAPLSGTVGIPALQGGEDVNEPGDVRPSGSCDAARAQRATPKPTPKGPEARQAQTRQYKPGSTVSPLDETSSAPEPTTPRHERPTAQGGRERCSLAEIACKRTTLCSSYAPPTLDALRYRTLERDQAGIPDLASTVTLRLTTPDTTWKAKSARRGSRRRSRSSRLSRWREMLSTPPSSARKASDASRGSRPPRKQGQAANAPGRRTALARLIR